MWTLSTDQGKRNSEIHWMVEIQGKHKMSRLAAEEKKSSRNLSVAARKICKWIFNKRKYDELLIKVSSFKIVLLL